MLQHHIRNEVVEGDEEEESEDNFKLPTRAVSADPRTNCQYSAPEALLSAGNYDAKVDVWAVGCLLSELLHCCNSDVLREHGSSPYPLPFLARFLFRPPQGETSLPLIKKYLICAPDDLEDSGHDGTMKKLSDRAWNSLVSRGFISPVHENRSFPWEDICTRFKVPTLPAAEVPIFLKLRSLMLRMLAFDPDQRCSASDALRFLDPDAHSERVDDRTLEEFRTLQQMLDDSKITQSSSQREKYLKFIKHVDPQDPSRPSPLAMLLP
jgi:serine/threonine protein kinase